MAEKHLHPRYAKRLRMPTGMVSGLYKYIVFEPVEKPTGRVYDKLRHTIMTRKGAFPSAEWVTHNHWCAPLYYHPGRE